MMVPLIHLNGNSKESLQREIREAHDKLHDALVALGEMTINARNFYPIGPDAFTQARAEHSARLQRIQTTLDELQALWIHIDNGRFGEQSSDH